MKLKIVVNINRKKKENEIKIKIKRCKERRDISLSLILLKLSLNLIWEGYEFKRKLWISLKSLTRFGKLMRLRRGAMSLLDSKPFKDFKMRNEVGPPTSPSGNERNFRSHGLDVESCSIVYIPIMWIVGCWCPLVDGEF